MASGVLSRPQSSTELHCEDMEEDLGSGGSDDCTVQWAPLKPLTCAPWWLKQYNVYFSRPLQSYLLTTEWGKIHVKNKFASIGHYEIAE